MQDDFGDFLQAPPVTCVAHVQAQRSTAAITKMKDLDSKIMESFDLSGSNQKASLRFQQPAKYARKKPVNVQYKQSASSADWKSLDLNTSEFLAPVKQLPQRQQNFSVPAQPNRIHGSMNLVHPVSNTSLGQDQVHDFSSQLSTGHASPLALPNQITFTAQNEFKIQGSFVPNMPDDFHLSSGMQNSTWSQGNFHSGQELYNLQQQQLVSFPSETLNPKFPAGVQQQHTSPAIYAVSQPQVSSPIIYGPSSNVGQQEFTPKPMLESTDFTLPSWMTIPKEIPPLYKDVLKLCATPKSYADTARLYPIFVSSQLPKDVLGHIWSAANQSTPGQLTYSEVYIALALIALAQRGEMNLTVNYVTKLKTPPIPSLQLPAQSTAQQLSASSEASHVKFQAQTPTSAVVGNSTSTTQPSTLLKPVRYAGIMESANFSPEDDFADFQSVPAASSSTSDSFSSISSSFQSESKDFRSHNPPSESLSNLGAMRYPARDIINSPKSQHPKVVESKSDAPRKAILGSIDFSKFKSDPVKSLHAAAKTLKLKPSFIPSPTLSSNSVEDDVEYGDFIMNTENVQPSHGHTLSMSLSVPSSSNDQALSTKESSNCNDFSDFETAPVVQLQPGHGHPTVSAMSLGADSAKEEPGQLLDLNGGIHDKYSALRAISPVNSTLDPEVSDSYLEFSDFQSGSSTQLSKANSIQANDSMFAAIKDDSVPSTNHHVFGRNVVKEDSQSVSSLELPSLSKTISSLSIGSSSPNKPVEDLYSLSSFDKPEVFGDFASSATSEVNPIAQPLQAAHGSQIGQSKVLPASSADGLYSLDEPISPLGSRKFPETSQDKPPSKAKRFIVPRRISEADSDFGDFSSAPPPMDDLHDHHNGDFDDNQGGTSSLVDFDAFGHFEEAKEETRRKKEAMFGQKRSKKDATAFSEFVESSIKNLKPSNEVNSTSNPESAVPEHVEEGWSAFSGSEAGNNGDVSRSNQVDNEGLTVESNANGSDAASRTWKLESTVPDSEADTTKPISKWDEEGEELRARMEGSSKQNTVELYAEHWGRCLATCKDIIVSTGEIFAALNSPTVCHEIVNSSRGKEFIICTSEVYGVARRIKKGMESVGLLDEDLEATIKEIEIAWQNLLGFCPYTPSVHKTPEHCCSPPKDMSNGVSDLREQSACSLCLLSTSGGVPVGLEYGGKSYHAPCANLWLNQIAPMLPRLELPGFL